LIYKFSDQCAPKDKELYEWDKWGIKDAPPGYGILVG